jgi:hypothetical protein
MNLYDTLRLVEQHVPEWGLTDAWQRVKGHVYVCPFLGEDTAGKMVWVLWKPVILLNPKWHPPQQTLPWGVTLLHELIHVRQGWFSAVREMVDEAHHNEREEEAEKALDIWYNTFK